MPLHEHVVLEDEPEGLGPQRGETSLGEVMAGAPTDEVRTSLGVAEQPED